MANAKRVGDFVRVNTADLLPTPQNDEWRWFNLNYITIVQDTSTTAGLNGRITFTDGDQNSVVSVRETPEEILGIADT